MTGMSIWTLSFLELEPQCRSRPNSLLFFMYGRKARFPLEVEKSATPSISCDLADIDQVVSRLSTVKTTTFPRAEKNILASQKRQKELHKRRKHFYREEFKVGSLVLRMNMKQRLRKGGKLEDKWLGPYRVLDVTQYGCCKLACVRTGVVLKAKVNQSQLKTFRNPIAPKAYALTAEGSPPKDSAPEVSILTKGYCQCSNKSFVFGKDDSRLEENGKHLGESDAQHLSEKDASEGEHGGLPRNDTTFGRVEIISQDNEDVCGEVFFGRSRNKVRFNNRFRNEGLPFWFRVLKFVEIVMR